MYQTPLRTVTEAGWQKDSLCRAHVAEMGGMRSVHIRSPKARSINCVSIGDIGLTEQKAEMCEKDSEDPPSLGKG